MHVCTLHIMQEELFPVYDICVVRTVEPSPLLDVDMINERLMASCSAVFGLGKSQVLIM